MWTNRDMARLANVLVDVDVQSALARMVNPNDLSIAGRFTRESVRQWWVVIKEKYNGDGVEVDGDPYVGVLVGVNDPVFATMNAPSEVCNKMEVDELIYCSLMLLASVMVRQDQFDDRSMQVPVVDLADVNCSYVSLYFARCLESFPDFREGLLYIGATELIGCARAPPFDIAAMAAYGSKAREREIASAGPMVARAGGCRLPPGSRMPLPDQSVFAPGDPGGAETGFTGITGNRGSRISACGNSTSLS